MTLGFILKDALETGFVTGYHGVAVWHVPDWVPRRIPEFNAYLSAYGLLKGMYDPERRNNPHAVGRLESFILVCAPGGSLCGAE